MQCIIFAFDCIMHSLACLCIPSHFNRISNRMHLNAFDEIWKWVQMRLNASTCTRMWQGCGRGAGGGTGNRMLQEDPATTPPEDNKQQLLQPTATSCNAPWRTRRKPTRAHPDLLSLEGSIGGVGAEGAADMRRMHQHAYICCKMWKHVARCGHIPRPRTSPRRGPWSGSPAKRACFSNC